MENKAYRNKEFYEHMKKAVKASLSYLKNKEEKGQIKPVEYLDFRIDMNEKSWKTYVNHRYHLELLFLEYENEILKLPEVVSCMDFMVKNGFHRMVEMVIVDNNGKIVEDVETYKKYMGHEIIGTFLVKYVKTENGLNYNEITFNSLYNELEEYIYTEGMEIIAVAPLLNFELEGRERINLGDCTIEDYKNYTIRGEYTIRKLTEDEIKMFLRRGAFGKPLISPHGGYISTIWCVELKAKFPSKREHTALDPHITRIITALRLFKKGSLLCSTILEYPKYPVWESSLFSSAQVKVTNGSLYKLTDDAVENFKVFWNKFRNIENFLKKRRNGKNQLYLDLAIRRFNFSYERSLDEDKLIDLITAFEALFLPGTKEALGYKLALRCAYFLGKDKEERKKIFYNLKDAYGRRSKIVHGENKQSKEESKPLPDLVGEIEEYLRESIKRFLNELQTKSYNKIIEEIDETIISGGKRIPSNT